MAETQVRMVEMADGRRVAVHQLSQGDTGRTVVFCHAAPGAGNFDPDPEQTQARGVTLLAVDRPGYGQSDPRPETDWASIGAAADDIAVVLTTLSSGPVGVAGWSAGGRVALALAARHPQLVDRLVMLGTPAPHEHVAWIAPEQLSALDALRGLPPSAAYTALLQQLTGLIPHSVESPAALDLLSVSAADAEALARPGARERLTGMLSAAFAQGLGGLAADLAGYTLQPWGFELETVQAKTLLLYGSKDPVAASRHGSWWQKHLPNARLEVVPNAGHLLVIPMWQRVLSHLAPAAKRKL